MRYQLISAKQNRHAKMTKYPHVMFRYFLTDLPRIAVSTCGSVHCNQSILFVMKLLLLLLLLLHTSFKTTTVD